MYKRSENVSECIIHLYTNQYPKEQKPKNKNRNKISAGVQRRRSSEGKEPDQTDLALSSAICLSNPL